MSRPSPKQRLRQKKIARAERERRKQAGRVRMEHAETDKQRRERERAEAEAERLRKRRDEHALPEGKLWGMVDGKSGHTARLCRDLTTKKIPHFRAQDEVRIVLPSGQKRTVKVPLVARVVFVGIDAEEAKTLTAEDRDALKAMSPWIENVHVDHQAERPVQVPEADLRAFAETLIGAKPTVDAARRPYDPGDLVRVIDGPFASFDGVVEEVDDERGVLKVNVNIFGRGTPVELDLKQVERRKGS